MDKQNVEYCPGQVGGPAGEGGDGPDLDRPRRDRGASGGDRGGPGEKADYQPCLDL